MTISELAERLETVRRKLLQAIGGLTDEEMTQGKVNREWTIKDILGHITSWEEEDRKIAESILSEDCPQFDYSITPDKNWREWNRKQIEKKKDYTIRRIYDELEVEHQRFVDMVKGLSEEQLSRKGTCPWQRESTVEELIQATIEHDEEHTEKISEWRKRKE
jgi:uncharacterized damage-inducible protein DinB